MLEAIKYNLTNLTNLHGRDARSTFWFYVLFLVIMQFVVSFVIAMPFVGSMTGGAINAAREGATSAEMQGRIFAGVNSMMRATMWTSVAISFAMILLLAASFTRRLHDSDKTGWIAAVVVALQLIALTLTIISIEDAVRLVVMSQSGDLAGVQSLQRRFALQGLVGWLPVGVLVVFGAWPGTKGDNRYGPGPDGASGTTFH